MRAQSAEVNTAKEEKKGESEIKVSERLFLMQNNGIFSDTVKKNQVSQSEKRK